MRIIRQLVVLSIVIASPSISPAAEPTPAVGGDDWRFSSVELLRLPREFVESMGPLLGIVPEGENTQALCESSGSMTLVQAGSTFQGTATKEFNQCETSGGQLFVQPSTLFDVVGGHIAGQTAHFSFQSATVQPCPHSVVIAEIEDGEALTLLGTGWCVLPGHPQSDSPIPIPPPPGGTSKTLSFEANRL